MLPSRKRLTNAAYAALSVLLLQAFSTSSVVAAQIDIHGPPGSGLFGYFHAILPNGNIVIVDPEYSIGSIRSVGAAYLYSPEGVLISSVTGSRENDAVGSNGIVVLSNGNFLISSARWNNGDVSAAGAVTWGHADTGVSGVVSADNSLVGSSSGDTIGRAGGIHALPSGHYFVTSGNWDSPLAADAGAVTWGDGDRGISGAITEHNSLIGSTAEDRLGVYDPIAVGDDDYVFRSPYFDAEGQVDSGAVVWMDGAGGLTGRVSRANALIGTHAGDKVGTWAIVLSNGNYVVGSPAWDNDGIADAGAATWADGRTGLRGAVSASNSLIGASSGDQTAFRITALRNGHYVVSSPYWDSATSTNVGAVTWGNGYKGRVGVVAPSNSLIGSSNEDRVGGLYGVEPLQNGNYVVISVLWDNGGGVGVGAATWMYGRKGRSAVVSNANSLIGTQTGDLIGASVLALSNGNYALVSPQWDNAAIADAGAVTWGDGRSGTTGVISAANSLVGSSTQDLIGHAYGVGAIYRTSTALANGHYVIGSPEWDNAGLENAGAVTWADGRRPSTGPIQASNSLVGARQYDGLGNRDVIALDNGRYLVANSLWDDGDLVNVGAVTLSTGTAPLAGTISPANSLIGRQAGDKLGSGSISLLGDGAFAVRSPDWNDGDMADVGAITWIDSNNGLPATISASNSLIGTNPGDQIGDAGISLAPDGNYLIHHRHVSNGDLPRAGAVSITRDGVPPTSALPETDVVWGTAAGLGYQMRTSYLATRRQLVVCRYVESIVSVLNLPPPSTSNFSKRDRAATVGTDPDTHNSRHSSAAADNGRHAEQR